MVLGATAESAKILGIGTNPNCLKLWRGLLKKELDEIREQEPSDETLVDRFQLAWHVSMAQRRCVSLKDAGETWRDALFAVLEPIKIVNINHLHQKE